MSKFSKRFFQMGALSSAILLAGCSGSTGEEAVAETTASLSGVVEQGLGADFSAKPNGKSVAFATAVGSTSFDSLAATPIANALVLVTDSSGNTQSDMADSSGAFDVDGLAVGKNYALIFIDTKTMEVIGSLVQAANPASAAELGLSGDTDLGDIVIDRASGRAVAEKDAKGAVTTVASSLDADNDGVISNDEITNAQATNIDNISKLSIMSFMGEADTWAIYREPMNGGGTDNWTMSYGGETVSSPRGANGHVDVQMDRSNARDMYINRAVSVPGPDGTNVKAIKSGSLSYYSDTTGSMDTNYGDNGTQGDGDDQTPVAIGGPGYFNYPTADNCIAGKPCAGPGGANWTMFNDASGSNDMIHGWANYRYLDAATNMIYEGRRDHQSGELEWSTMIPNNVELGKPVSMNRDETWTEWDQTLNSGAGGEIQVRMVVDMSILIEKVTGGIAIDTAGNKLPVVKVTFDENRVATKDIGDGAGFVAYPDETGAMKGAMYVMAKYGVSAAAYDTNGTCTTPNDMTSCPSIPWTTALSEARFGVLAPEDGLTKVRGIWSVAGASGGCMDVKDPTDGTTALVTDSGFTTVDGAGVTQTLYNVAPHAACITTPNDLTVGLASGSASAMPSYDMASPGTGTLSSTTATLADGATASTVARVRNSWLQAMSIYIDQLDRRQDGGNSYAWFYLDHNGESGAIDPISWDPATYMSKPLSELATVNFETDATPDGSTDLLTNGTQDTLSSLHYYAPNDGSNYYMAAELRTFNPNGSFTDDKGNVYQGAEETLVTSADVLAMATDADTQQVGNWGLTIPALTNASYYEKWIEWHDLKDGAGNPGTDGNYEAYCASGVSLVLSIRKEVNANDITGGVETDDEILEMHPVNWYSVLGTTELSVGDTCGNHTYQ